MLHMKLQKGHLEEWQGKILITLSSSLLAHIPGCFPIFLRIPLPWALWGKEDHKADQVGRCCRRFWSPSCPKQGQIRCQTTGGFIQLAPESLQARRVCVLSGQPLPLLSSPHFLIVQKFPVIQCKPLLFQFMPVVLLSPIHHPPPPKASAPALGRGDPPLNSLQIINIFYFKDLLLITTFTAHFDLRGFFFP